MLRRRLETALAERGVALDRLRMLPHLPRASYLEANRLCDVMLDTTRWSGGNTTLDALAAGLPVVTRRGRFMRGRQSAGMLEIIGLPELIAENDDDYAAIALRLGRDKALAGRAVAPDRRDARASFRRSHPRRGAGGVPSFS